ncbi:MAG: hypothetical protein L0K86_13760, partial [Actinomycetia bacterium]|nr:hypothetical protein [Actinomycetes bacterium]
MKVGTTVLISSCASAEFGSAANAFEPLGRPRRLDGAPVVVGTGRELREERVGAHRVADPPRVAEQALCPVDRRQRRVGMLASHVLDV